MEKELPVIDLALAKGAERGHVVEQLRHALSTVGFTYLKNVEGFNEEELLRFTKWFYSLSLEQKMEVSKKSFNSKCKNEYRGYYPIIPGVVSHKEGFEIGAKQEITEELLKSERAKFFLEENQWPQEDTEEGRHFKTWVENYYQKITEASLEVMRLIAEGFDAPSDFFSHLFKPNHLSTLRLIRYPARPDAPSYALDGDDVIQVGEHRDSVLVTLLATFEQYPGLQVRWWQDDSILDVPHKPGHLVMNIGDLLSHMSGGKLKATRHRVVDKCGERFSVPFFLEPGFDADVNIVLPGSTLDSTAAKHYGPWLWEKIENWAEYKELLKRIRSLEGHA